MGLGFRTATKARGTWHARGVRWVLVAALVLAARGAFAEDMTIPSSLQAKLLSRVLLFDRSQSARAPKEIIVLVVVHPDDGGSMSAGLQMVQALKDIGTVHDEPLRPVVLPYVSAVDVAREVTERRASVVYITPNMGAQVRPMSLALTGKNVLTFGALESYVASGAVLGVDAVSGKPRISINLPQAHAQNVDFSADALKLMKVYR